MPATGTAKTPKQVFEELCQKQGRKKSWCAERAGMTLAQLSNKFAGRYGYAWQPGEREAIADALGVPFTHIWGEQDADAGVTG